MCKAWKDGIERGRAEGRAEGKATGRTEMLAQLIKKGYLTLEEATREFDVKQELLVGMLTGGN